MGEAQQSTEVLDGGIFAELGEVGLHVDLGRKVEVAVDEASWYR
jgi:hypothetical protein